MLNPTRLLIDAAVDELQHGYRGAFGGCERECGAELCRRARQALEAIAEADTLYHNVEHTVMVALAGQTILAGKQMLDGDLEPRDWLHVTLALLYHDIGYVPGICRADRGGRVATGVGERTVAWPAGKSAAVLAPYHVDRGKLFVRECLAGSELDIDIAFINDCIERTRFPVPATPAYQQTADLPGLVRAADFIGQLADPGYLRKIPALFYEQTEAQTVAELGYANPGSMRKDYRRFFTDKVRPYIQDALNYLEASEEGRLWTAQLYAHVFSAAGLAQETDTSEGKK